MKKELSKNKGRIRARIKKKGVSLDINVIESTSSLREVRRILEALNESQDEQLPDVMISADSHIGWAFSEELRSDRGVMEFLRQAGYAEQGNIYRKAALETTKVFDNDRQEQYLRVEPETVRKGITSALHDIDSSKARLVLLHIVSTASKEDKAMIIDQVRKVFGDIDIKTHFTHKDLLGKAIVEMAVFGDFPTSEIC